MDRCARQRPAGASRPIGRYGRRVPAGRRHALAHAINQALGNIGTTVTYGGSIEPQPVEQASLAELATAMEAGQVQLLLILGNNPVFTAPADVKFGERLAKVSRRLPQPLPGRDLSLSLEHPRHAPARDVGRSARVHDGTVTLMQPLIAPLYDAHSAHEVLATLTSQPTRKTLEIVKDYWTRGFGGAGMDGAQRRRRDVPQRRRLLEAGRPRRVHSRHGHGSGGQATPFKAAPAAPPRPLPRLRRQFQFRHPQAAPVTAAPSPLTPPARGSTDSNSSSGPIQQCGTGASPTTAGSRKHRNRSRN